ncbi:MAG TPA: hypothetical protein PLR76_05245 [Hyphomonas sp.]|nr:hypothetical protein [Hyphomonas sp.]HPE47777.1 hypothetical protein [Hyphomonas sp.]
MRFLAAAGFLALSVLAGCGQAKSGHQQLVDACTEKGEEPATCSCIVSAMEAKLNPDLFKRTVVAVVREKRDVEAFVSSLPDSEKMEYLGAAVEMGKCKLAGSESK